MLRQAGGQAGGQVGGVNKAGEYSSVAAPILSAATDVKNLLGFGIARALLVSHHLAHNGDGHFSATASRHLSAHRARAEAACRLTKLLYNRSKLILCN